jgi:membrane-associated phospholipid phosphatase
MTAVLGRARAIVRPEEVVLATFALALVAIVAITGNLPQTFAPPMWRVLRRLHVYFVACVAAGAALWIARASRTPAAADATARRSRLLRLARDFAPFYGVAVLYEALAQLTPVLRPAVVDAALIRIDRAWLGVDAALWLERFASPGLSWALAACYGSYFVLPAGLAIALYARGDHALFRDLMLAGVFAAALAFAGYLLVPAVGPYAFQAELYPHRLPGNAYCPSFIRMIDDLRGVARDCFPSLHVAHATIVAVIAFRFRRWLFVMLLPIVIGLIVSTLYLRMHYAIDLVAGAAVGVGAVALAPLVNRRWAARAFERGEQPA